MQILYFFELSDFSKNYIDMKTKEKDISFLAPMDGFTFVDKAIAEMKNNWSTSQHLSKDRFFHFLKYFNYLYNCTFSKDNILQGE